MLGRVRQRACAAAALVAATVLLPGARAILPAGLLQDDIGSTGFLGLGAEQNSDAQALSDFDAAAAPAPPSSGGASADGAWAPVRLAPGAADATALSATSDGSGGFVLQPLAEGGNAGDFLASGNFADSLSELGWSGLSMRISPDGGASDGAKMYAAGVVEGVLTARRIREFHHNSRALVEMSPENRERLPQLEKALSSLVSELAGPGRGFEAPQDGSPFDQQARLALLQTWGVRDGYQLAAGSVPALSGAQALSMVDMFILNSDGVIDELLSKYGSPAGGSLLQRRSSRTRALRGLEAAGTPQAGEAGGKRKRRRPTGHCTGLVRLSGDKSELFFGHTTWEGFSEMTRVWKVYDFPLQGVAAKKISFSSYPGCVSSTDDYYLMDSGLAITETTLSIPRQQEYPAAGHVPDFIRIMASNRLSSTADDWVRSMADSATGTYSSQWLVVDYKKFSPGSAPPDGTFFVLEQAPGVSHYEDMTQALRSRGYWASFDRAFFDDVRARTGDAAMEAQGLKESRQAEAAIYSKDDTPRAQIASHTSGDVNSLAAMREEMTRNRGTEEPVAQAALRVPRFAISARDDLKDDAGHSDPDGSPDGGVDAKVTNHCLFQNLAAEAISGPSHATLPPFRWTGADGSETWPGYPHEGLPDVADFGWVRAGPGLAADGGGAEVLSRLEGADGGAACQ